MIVSKSFNSADAVVTFLKSQDCLHCITSDPNKAVFVNDERTKQFEVHIIGDYDMTVSTVVPDQDIIFSASKYSSQASRWYNLLWRNTPKVIRAMISRRFYDRLDEDFKARMREAGTETAIMRGYDIAWAPFSAIADIAKSIENGNIFEEVAYQRQQEAVFGI